MLSRFVLIGVVSYLVNSPSYVLAQIRAVEAGSAEALSRQQDYFQRLRDDERRFAKAHVVHETSKWLAPSKDDIAKDLELRLARRPKVTDGVKLQIKTLRERRVKAKTKEAREAIDSDLADYTAKLRTLETGGPELGELLRPRLNLDELEVGQIGLPGGDKILFSVLQVVDESNLLVTHGRKTYWITSTSTEALVDKEDVVLKNLMKVTSTKTYTTLTGTNTVFVLEPIDPRPGDAAVLAATKNDLPPPVADAPLARTWTSADGSFSTEAAFAGATGNLVKLQKPDGTIVSVPIEKLSQGDRDWIRNRGK